jgi:hypothetical protein
MSSNSIQSELETKPNQDLDENSMNDPLIHDTVLPHRKRIRKDPLQYVQCQQSSTTCQINDVSSV